MIFQKLLVGFDHSETSIAAVEWACQHVAVDGQVRLIHVDEEIDDQEDRLARAVADFGPRYAGHCDLSSQTLRASGFVADGLSREAQRFGAEAVVVGAPHHEDWHPHTVSRTAARLHRNGGGPMAVVHPTAVPQSSTVVVGVDGTEDSLKALKWAAGRIGPDDSVRIVWILAHPLADYAPMIAHESSGLVRAAEDFLRHRAADIFSDEVPVEIEVRPGSPAKDLARETSSDKILVIGHGHHNLVSESFGASAGLQLMRIFEGTMIIVP